MYIEVQFFIALGYWEIWEAFQDLVLLGRSWRRMVASSCLSYMYEGFIAGLGRRYYG